MISHKPTVSVDRMSVKTKTELEQPMTGNLLLFAVVISFMNPPTLALSLWSDRVEKLRPQM
jgi:hypothetical protein